MFRSFSLRYCYILLPVASINSPLLHQPILLFLGHRSNAWCLGLSYGQSSLYRATSSLIFPPQLFAYQDKAIMTRVRWSAAGRVSLTGITKIKERWRKQMCTANIGVKYFLQRKLLLENSWGFIYLLKLKCWEQDCSLKAVMGTAYWRLYLDCLLEILLEIVLICGGCNLITIYCAVGKDPKIYKALQVGQCQISRNSSTAHWNFAMVSR